MFDSNTALLYSARPLTVQTWYGCEQLTTQNNSFRLRLSPLYFVPSNTLWSWNRGVHLPFASNGELQDCVCLTAIVLCRWTVHVIFIDDTKHGWCRWLSFHNYWSTIELRSSHLAFSLPFYSELPKLHVGPWVYLQWCCAYVAIRVVEQVTLSHALHASNSMCTSILLCEPLCI